MNPEEIRIIGGVLLRLDTVLGHESHPVTAAHIRKAHQALSELVKEPPKCPAEYCEERTRERLRMSGFSTPARRLRGDNAKE